MNRIVVNIATGEQTVVPLTQEELDEIASRPAPSVPVPQSVTMRQARLALLHQGLLDQVNSMVATMPGAQGDAVRIEWEFSSTVERNRPFVNSLSDALGLTSIQLDNLFKLAATL